LPFQENPKTGDCRISGTCASLAGLEKALHEGGPAEVELAIRRILLLHGIIMTVGGIPLIYLGDEIGVLNDYRYNENPDKAGDSRWVHRTRANWEHYERRNEPKTVEGRIFGGLKKLVKLRQSRTVFSSGELETIQTENEHVLGYIRSHQGERAIIFANFSEQEQVIPVRVLEQYTCFAAQKLSGRSKIINQKELIMAALDLVVLCR